MTHVKETCLMAWHVWLTLGMSVVWVTATLCCLGKYISFKFIVCVHKHSVQYAVKFLLAHPPASTSQQSIQTYIIYSEGNCTVVMSASVVRYLHICRVPDCIWCCIEEVD